VLLQANPKLTVEQVQMALQATATKVTNTGTSATAAFWQGGYGFVDLNAAVKLVRRADYASAISAAQAAATSEVLATGSWNTTRSDIWAWAAPPVTVAGSDSQTFTLNVPSTTKAIKVALGYPSGGAVLASGMSYYATVTDAAGTEIGETSGNFWNGSASLFVDVRNVANLKYGKWTIEVVGDHAASDPDTLDSDSAAGRVVTAQFVQLQPR
jgi:serine protease AprX